MGLTIRHLPSQPICKPSLLYRRWERKLTLPCARCPRKRFESRVAFVDTQKGKFTAAMSTLLGLLQIKTYELLYTSLMACFSAFFGWEPEQEAVEPQLNSKRHCCVL